MKKTWVKKRHSTVKKFLHILLVPYLKRKYGFTYEHFSDTDNRPYLILANHQTPMDQFMFAACFNKLVYFIASEDIFSIPFGKTIRHLVAPIPFIKSKKNISSIITCKQIAKEGASIFMMPEGNRTYSGVTEYINPTVTKLAKMLKLPIGFMVLRGGYGVRPRWSENIRKGTTHCAVKSVLEYETYKDWSEQQLYEYICKELYVDESNDNNEYCGKNLAQYIERAIYYCPHCGVTHFVSRGNEFTCTMCLLTVIYNPNKQFSSKDENPPPFKNIKEWYDAQRVYLLNLDYDNLRGQVTSDKVKVFKVFLLKKKKKLFSNALLTLFADKVVMEKCNQYLQCDFLKTVESMTVLGKNKLEIFCGENVYQIVGDKHFNAVKYVNFFYKYKNFMEGNHDSGQFLGL